MNANAIQAGLFVIVVALLVKPVGAYLERVFERRRLCLIRLLLPMERLIHRLMGIDPKSRNGLERLFVGIRRIWCSQHHLAVFRALLAGLFAVVLSESHDNADDAGPRG